MTLTNLELKVLTLDGITGYLKQSLYEKYFDLANLHTDQICFENSSLGCS